MRVGASRVSLGGQGLSPAPMVLERSGSLGREGWGRGQVPCPTLCSRGALGQGRVRGVGGGEQLCPRVLGCTANFVQMDRW